MLKNTFKHNHQEDLELSSLNITQRKYLKKLLKHDQAKIPFKLPHREANTSVQSVIYDPEKYKEMHMRQMSQSVEISSLEKQKNLSTYTINKEIKFPQVKTTTNKTKNASIFGKRFNSVKARGYLNNSVRKGIGADIQAPGLPTTCHSISDALPLAIQK